MELASALTAATILADAAVTPTVSEMTYNVSSETLNHTQPTSSLGLSAHLTFLFCSTAGFVCTVC